MQEFQDEFGTDVAKSLKNMELIDLDKEEPERRISNDKGETKKLRIKQDMIFCTRSCWEDSWTGSRSMRRT